MRQELTLFNATHHTTTKITVFTEDTLFFEGSAAEFIERVIHLTSEQEQLLNSRLCPDNCCGDLAIQGVVPTSKIERFKLTVHPS